MPLSEYISFFLVKDSSDYLFQWHLNLCMRRPKEAAWNLGNNFAELEGEAVEAFQKEVGNFVPVGPLLPELIMRGETLTGGSTLSLSVWEEEAGCKEWLDEQKERSVLYISFGSIANMEEEQVEELVRGVENSGAPFLWAVRPDQGGPALDCLRRNLASQRQRHRQGLLVAWAPQVEVLTHKSVGGFLSHCGWNSVTESVSAGVPILAMPGGFAEQRMNAFYITNVWKIGLMLASSSTLKRGLVSQQITALLGHSPSIRERLESIRKAALVAISPPSGSSYLNFQLFLQDMHRRARATPSSSLFPPTLQPIRTPASPVH